LIRLIPALPGMASSARLVGALGASLFLAACGITQSVSDLGRIEYRSAKKAERLEIPPDLVSPRRDDRFVLPGSGEAASTTYSAYARDRTAERRAGGAGAAVGGVLPELAGSRIERDGNQRWLVVDLPASQVWPIVRSFWLEAGFNLTTDSPETGILETDWAENRPPVPEGMIRSFLERTLGSSYVNGERDRFRTRLEAVGNTTEIYVSHRGLVEEFTSPTRESTRWAQRRGDVELETEFLRRLRLRLSGPQAVAAADVGASAAGGASAAPRAVLVKGGEAPALRLAEGFDRAWRQVGLALDRSGFTVEDRDRSAGTFFVRYVDPQADASTKGLFSRVFGGGGDRDLSGRRYRILVAAEPPASAGQAASVIRILDEKGAAPATDAERRVAARIATLLQEQLR
jgi:outer membrane protein assembly factor BamC